MTFVWTPPRTWATSEVDTSAFFNAHLGANMQALIAGVQAYNTSDAMTGLTNGTTAAISFDAVTHDPLGLWSAAAPTRITVPVSGWYRFRGCICGFATAGYQTKLFKNGAAAVSGQSSTSDNLVGEYDVQCAAGDYLELKLVVASGVGGFGFAVSGTQGRSIFTDTISMGTVADLAVRWVSP